MPWFSRFGCCALISFIPYRSLNRLDFADSCPSHSHKTYQTIYLDYVKSKVGEIVPNWQPGRTVHLPDKTRVDIPEIKPKSYDGDMSDFPVFTYPQPRTGERIKDALLDIALLMLWNIACFLGAHVIFLQRDIA